MIACSTTLAHKTSRKLNVSHFPHTFPDLGSDIRLEGPEDPHLRNSRAPIQYKDVILPV